MKEAVIEGERKNALFGRVRILGAENVEKVKDGRWIHLSMGADLEEGKLSELTITPFPAAAHASMLAKGKSENTTDAAAQPPIKTLKINDDEVEIHANVTGKFYAEIKGKYVGSLFDRQEDAEKDGKLAAEKLNVASGVFFAKGSPDSDQVQGELAKDEPEDKLSKGVPIIKSKTTNSHGDLIIVLEMPDGSKKTLEYPEGSHSDARQDLKDLNVLSSKGESMFSRLKKRLSGGEPVKDADEKSAHNDQPEKLSYADMKVAMEKYEKCRKHLMEKEGMDEESADKHLAEMDDESIEKMSAEMAKAEPEKLSRLSRLASAQKEVKLAQAKAKLSIRLSSLRAQGKITPAEIKKIDLSKLAASSEEAIELAISTYENREPVIDARIYGSAKGVEAADLIRLAKEKDLEEETRKNFKSAGGNKTRLSTTDEDKKVEEIKKEVQMGTSHHEMLKAVLAHMEAGEHDQAKEKLKACMSKMGEPTNDEVMSADAEKHLTALASANANLEQLIKELI